MAGLSNLDSLVVKQLAKLGLSLDRPPTLRGWQKFLDRVNRHYKNADDDRRLLTRSLDLSSAEMSELGGRLADEHDRLRQMISAISDGLRGFHTVIERVPASVTQGDVSEVQTTIRRARDHLSRRLSEPFEGAGISAWSRDEAAHIRREFTFLADQLLDLLQATVQRATVQKDLEVARAVQHLLMPGREVIKRRSLEIAGCFQPAAQCGGDWWSTYDLADDCVLTIVGDVTGRGVAQAIITGVARASCDVALLLLGDRVTCNEILDLLNRCICQAAQHTLGMSCVASIVDLGAHTLTVANAGHPFPVLSRRRGGEPDLSQQIPAGRLLGASRQSWYEAATIALEDGDIVVWYTDGVTSAQSQRGEAFGEPRLRRVLADLASDDPAEIRDGIMKEISAFCGTSLPTDDVTMVVACVAF